MVTETILPVVIPADHVPGPPQGQWTYEAYLELPDDGNRYELIDGVLYMAPPPSDIHQFSNAWFIHYLIVHVQAPGHGRVIGPPFDVKLPDEPTAMQPDIIVVRKDRVSIIASKGVMGRPDLVVEIASPSTATHDRHKKLAAYERGGVPEYWIADPIAQTIELFVLEQGAYRSRGVFQGTATLPSVVVPGFPVRVEQFFA